MEEPPPHISMQNTEALLRGPVSGPHLITELLPVLERHPHGHGVKVPQHPPLAAVQPLRRRLSLVDDQYTAGPRLERYA